MGGPVDLGASKPRPVIQPKVREKKDPVRISGAGSATSSEARRRRSGTVLTDNAGLASLAGGKTLLGA